jgi:hypothetical protein
LGEGAPGAFGPAEVEGGSEQAEGAKAATANQRLSGKKLVPVSNPTRNSRP